MSNKKSSDLIQRLKLITCTKTDSSLSDALGLTPQTLSSWKGRDHIPYAICVKFAAQHNLSLDWLLSGIGPMSRSKTVQKYTNTTQRLNAREQKILQIFRTLNEPKKLHIEETLQEQQRTLDLEIQLQSLTATIEELRRHNEMYQNK